MKRLFILVLLTLLIFSCNRSDSSGFNNDLRYSRATNFSNIRFRQDNDTEFPFPKAEIKEQIRVISSHDPIDDSKKAHRSFNNRFIGFMGFSLITPGVDVERLGYNDEAKTLTLWGLTELGPDGELLVVSFRYCYLYNTNLLKLTKREHLIKRPDEKENYIIRRYYPDFDPDSF